MIRIEVFDRDTGETRDVAIDRRRVEISDSATADVCLPGLPGLNLEIVPHEEYGVVQGTGDLPPLAIGGAPTRVYPMRSPVAAHPPPVPPVLRSGDVLDIGPYQLTVRWRAADAYPIRIGDVLLPVGGSSGAAFLFRVGGYLSLVAHVAACRDAAGRHAATDVFYAPVDEPPFVVQEHPTDRRRLIVHHQYHARWSCDGGGTFVELSADQHRRLGIARFLMRKLWFADFADDGAIDLAICDFRSEDVHEVMSRIRAAGLRPEVDPVTLEDAAAMAAWCEVWRVDPTGACRQRDAAEPGSARAAELAARRASCQRAPTAPALRLVDGGVEARDGAGGWRALDLRGLAVEALHRTGASF